MMRLNDGIRGHVSKHQPFASELLDEQPCTMISKAWILGDYR
jgi:hypothetical protein